MRFFKHTALSVLFAAIGVVSLGVSGASAKHQWADYHWALPSDGITALTIDVNNCQSDPGPGLNYYDTVNQFSGPNLNWNSEISLAGGVFGVEDVGDGDSCPAVDSSATAFELDNTIAVRSTPYDHLLDVQGTVNAFNADYGNNGWVGLAIAQIDNDDTGDNHIIYGETHLNEYYPINFASTYDDPAVMRKVQCQEIGHTLGLDHIKKDGSCMYSSRARLGTVNTPNGHDGEMGNTITHIHDGTTPPPDDDGGKGGGPPCGTKKGGPCSNGTVIGKAIWAERFDSRADMYESADLVVTANVLKGSTLDRFAGGLPTSRVVLKVEDTYAGQSVPVILLEQTRGDGLEVEDDPGYIAGDNYLLYLREINTNTYRVINPTGRIRQ